MKQNIGAIDRIIRILIAVGFFYAAFSWPMAGAIRIVLAIIGGLLLVTAVTGFCGLYKLIGISTSKKSSSENQEPVQKGQ